MFHAVSPIRKDFTFFIKAKKIVYLPIMKTRRYTFIIILLSLLHIFPASHAEDYCDSLIQVAIKASIEKDHQLSLNLLQEARTIATQKNSQEELFWVLTNIGINYAELLNYSDALDAFLEAYKIALDHLDKRHEMSILNNIAGVYMLDHKYDKAIEYYTLVYNTVKGSSDSLFIGGCAMNIANASAMSNNLPLSEQYIHIAERFLGNRPEELTQLNTLKAGIYLRKGNTHKALETALTSYRQAQELQDPLLQSYAEMALANVYSVTGNHTALIETIERCLPKKEINLEERRELFGILSAAYAETGAYDKALAAKDSLIATIDTLYNIQGRKQFENSRIQFELFRREKEIEEYRIQSRNSYIFIALSVIIAIILTWALINQTIKSKQQKRIIGLELERERQNQQLLQNQLQEQQARRQLEEERYHHELELKDKELMSKAMMMANRNDLIYKIIDTISETEAIKKSNDTSLKESIRQLLKMLNDNEEWKHFSTYFEQRNDAFINALKEQYPELSAQDIRFLSLVYLNLSTKEIALLLNITPEYCKKKKQLIAKKMGLENSKALYSFLSQL